MGNAPILVQKCSLLHQTRCKQVRSSLQFPTQSVSLRAQCQRCAALHRPGLAIALAVTPWTIRPANHLGTASAGSSHADRLTHRLPCESK